MLCGGIRDYGIMVHTLLAINAVGVGTGADGAAEAVQVSVWM